VHAGAWRKQVKVERKRKRNVEDLRAWRMAMNSVMREEMVR
jgi:hypothetical protein